MRETGLLSCLFLLQKKNKKFFGKIIFFFCKNAKVFLVKEKENPQNLEVDEKKNMQFLIYCGNAINSQEYDKIYYYIAHGTLL